MKLTIMPERGWGAFVLSSVLMVSACEPSDHGADGAVDGAIQTPDGSAADAALPRPDSGVRDGGAQASDAGDGKGDAGANGNQDASTPPLEDASVSGSEDASLPRPEDASVPGPEDASVPGPEDASVPGPEDASVPGPEDASTPGPQDASVSMDAAVLLDAGPADAGTPPFDAGQAPVDAGESLLDAGSGESDAGELLVPPPICFCGVPVEGALCSYGSSHSSCSLSCSLPHASSECVDDQCRVYECDLGWGDCPGDGSGCGTDLTSSTTSCGECGHACAAGEICAYGVCSAGCEPPLTDCGGVCTDLTKSTNHCGGCGDVCSPSGGQRPVCNGGVCSLTGTTCPPDQTECNGHCVALEDDVENCGRCGNVCPASDGSTMCIDGVCQPCAPGLTACPTGTPEMPITCQDTRRSSSACGECGLTCGSDLCIDGACVPTEDFRVYTGTVSDFVVDGQSVFVVDASGGTVSKVDAAGGAVTVLASGQYKPLQVAQAGGYVYWTNNLGGAVMRVSKSGGTPTVVASASQPTELVVDDSYVYWINATDSTINKRESNGGGATVVLADRSSAVYQLRQNSTHIAFSEYLVQVDSPGLMLVPKVGGEVVLLTRGGQASGLPTFTLTDDYLYIVTYDRGSGPRFSYGDWSPPIASMSPLGGGGEVYNGLGWWLSIPVNTQGAYPLRDDRVVPDGIYVYYISTDGIRKSAHCDNQWPAMVADASATQLAVDATHVYWTDGSAIYRIAK